VDLQHSQHLSKHLPEDKQQRIWTSSLWGDHGLCWTI